MFMGRRPLAGMSPDEAVRTVAKHLIKKYGRNGFVHLVELLHNCENGVKIGTEYGVTRQQVHQWRYKLGHVRTLFVPHPEIAKMLGVGTRKVI